MGDLRSLAPIAAALAWGVLSGCSAGGPLEAPPRDAGEDATVPTADSGDSAVDRAADGTTEGSEDAGLPEDDAPESGADGAAEAEVWILPPLPWDACSVFDASALDEASVAAGLAAVEYYDCPICHERSLARDDAGNVVLHLDGSRLGQGIYPPNLTNSPDGLGCWSNGEVVQAILFGVDRAGGPLCPPMPVWSKLGMDAGTAAAIVDFLRSLPPSENRVADTTCSPPPGDGGPGSEASADADAAE